MKIGMKGLTAYHVAALRILSAGIILLPFSIRAWKQIPKDKIPFVILSGFFGSFFPAFLYCLAETRIDSSLAAILNALTPVFAIIIGVTVFKLEVTRWKIIGVLIGFIGLLLLPFAGSKAIVLTDVSYASLVIIATVCYGVNVNMVGKYLGNVNSLSIASAAFSFLIIPCILILYVSGHFDLQFTDKLFMQSTVASCALGIFGTAIASVLFYILVKKAGAVFASLVTYGIPFVAVFWGLIFSEQITILQIGCLAIILAGVYLVNKKV